jgi:Cu2+-exporting ATPase
MSIAVASGLGAKYGILVKNGEVLESLSSINHVIFDKTGTLTEGGISVVGIYTEAEEWNETSDVCSPEIERLMSKLCAMERFAEHPSAQAVLDWLDRHELDQRAYKAEGFSYQPGQGIRAWVNGEQLLAGNMSLMSAHDVPHCERFNRLTTELDARGIGSFHVAMQGRQVALIAIEDRIREDARDLIAALKHEGLKLTLLTGDRRQSAEAIAERLGGLEVIAEVLPEEKDQVVKSLQAKGERVAMVGDGVNDAPALVRADVGIAMGSGTDVSIASADIVLMSSELEKVRLAIGLSRRTLLTIRQNIGISIIYNLIMVPLAMSAIVTPLVAAISMPMSSLAVIGNSARIRTLFKSVKVSVNRS